MIEKLNNYLIALDIGTTSTKGILYKIGQNIVAASSQSYPSFYPSPGIAEQDQDEVLDAVLSVVQSLMQDSGIRPSSVSALVFGGILHSIFPVDKQGRALCRPLLWADTRSSTQSERLRKELSVEDVRSRTGCTVHPLYFLPRLAWFREEAPDIVKRTYKFLSIKEYILHHLYGRFVVDKSTASGTGIWNIFTMDWDAELLRIAGITPDRLSQVVKTTYILKGLKQHYASRMGLLTGTPGIIGASDGPSAHLGSVGLNEDRMSLTIGTSAALRKNVPHPLVIPNTESWCYYATENNWVLGGVVHDAGIAYRIYSVYRMLTSGKETELVVTGGILKSPVWLQITADFLGKRLLKPKVKQAAAWGAALIALRALGAIKETAHINEHIETAGSIDFNEHNHQLYKKIRFSYDTYYKKLFSRR